MKIVVQKQDYISPLSRVVNVLICIVLAMAFCGVFILLQGQNPVEAYVKMFRSAFGSRLGITNSIVRAIPLMFCSLGVAVAFKMGINNIGAEGQFAMGAFAATGVALYMPFIPDFVRIPAMFTAAFLGGAVWGLIAIIPKALWGVNDTIVTLMLNYIALLFIDYLCYGPWMAEGQALAVSETIPESAQLSKYFNSNINIGVLIAVVIAVLIWFFFRYTAAGYQIRVISQSTASAYYAGINVVGKIFLVMAVSGGIAGLAGFAEVSGQVYKLQTDIANNAGFTGIVIAYLSKFNPFIILLVSFFFGGLTIGGFSIQVMGVSSELVTMLQGTILIFVLGGEILTRYRFTVVRNSKIKKEIKEAI